MENKFPFSFTKLKIKKTGVSAVILAAGILGATLIPENTSAHGFVEKPGSRAALCSPTYGALNLNCGEVMYEPQSLEAPKGFPQDGPIDKEIASAGGKFGGILNLQTANRWFKNTVKILSPGNLLHRIEQANGTIILQKKDGTLITP